MNEITTSEMILDNTSITAVNDGESISFFKTSELEAAAAKFETFDAMWWAQAQPVAVELSKEDEAEILGSVFF